MLKVHTNEKTRTIFNVCKRKNSKQAETFEELKL